MDKLLLFLDTNPCMDSGTLTIIYVVKIFIDVVFIILPIILIVLVSIDLFKNVIANKEDVMITNRNRAIRRIIYCIAAFFVPTIINLVMNIAYENIDDSTKESVSICWNNATLEKIKEYREIEEAGADQGLDEEAIQNWKDQAAANEPPSGLGSLKDEEEDSDTGSNISPGTPTNNNYTMFVGDSRTVGMCSSVSVGDNAKCIAENGKGIYWLKSTGIPSIKENLSTHSNANVVINLGVNDLGNKDANGVTALAKDYITAFQEITNAYPSAKLVIVSVGKVDNAVRPDISNESINLFNSTLKNAASNSLIGSNTSFCDVSTVNYVITDGVHYDSETYKSIYNAIMNCL